VAVAKELAAKELAVEEEKALVAKALALVKVARKALEKARAVQAKEKLLAKAKANLERSSQKESKQMAGKWTRPHAKPSPTSKRQIRLQRKG
jgi:hypothetical protein